MGSAAFALASFEVAIRRAGASFSGRQHIGVHADTHAASRVAPLETGISEDLIQAFLLGLRLNYAGARNYQRLLDP
jgi:hypothetical protein